MGWGEPPSTPELSRWSNFKRCPGAPETATSTEPVMRSPPARGCGIEFEVWHGSAVNTARAPREPSIGRRPFPPPCEERGRRRAAGRACFERRRAITERSAPTRGARSTLLITSRSDRVTPGPPFRGTLSPPATSTTKICRSTSPRLKVAVRLSPPDSISTSRRSGKRRSSDSTASRFAAMSSRIAVWGQQPVSTATIRSGSSTPALRRKSASSVV